MKRTIVTLCTVASLAATLVQAGSISGTVRAEGKSGVDAGAGGGGYESRKFKFAERVDYSELRDFIVYIDQPTAEKPVPPAKPLEVVVQKDASFTPHILPIVVGTTVEWPNRDEIFHNAFSFSEAKQFDLGYYKDKTKGVTFDKPGRVDVFCSIHKSMHCIILVLENPFYATADAKGRYTIPNVPPGKYRLKAWHERMPSQVKEIVVPESGDLKVDFVLGISGLPQY